MKLSVVGSWAGAAVLLLAAAPLAAQGGAGKIAYVNTQAVLKATPGYAQAESTFSKELDSAMTWKKDLDVRAGDLVYAPTYYHAPAPSTPINDHDESIGARQPQR